MLSGVLQYKKVFFIYHLSLIRLTTVVSDECQTNVRKVLSYTAVEGSSFVFCVGTTTIMDLVGIHRAMWQMSREKLCPIYFFPYGESRHHKMILSQVRNRNLKPSVTFFEAFLVFFLHEEIWRGLWEEGKRDQLDQCWDSTGGHQHGPQRLAAQQLPGREKSVLEFIASASRRERNGWKSTGRSKRWKGSRN